MTSAKRPASGFGLIIRNMSKSNKGRPRTWSGSAPSQLLWGEGVCGSAPTINGPVSERRRGEKNNNTGGTNIPHTLVWTWHEEGRGGRGRGASWMFLFQRCDSTSVLSAGPTRRFKGAGSKRMTQASGASRGTR